MSFAVLPDVQTLAGCACLFFSSMSLDHEGQIKAV